MESKITFSQEAIEQFANAIIEKLLPQLENVALKQDEEGTLSIDEAAVLLGKSRQQIYQWVSRAKHGLMDFPYMKAGRSLRFSKKDLIGWMKKQGRG